MPRIIAGLTDPESEIVRASPLFLHYVVEGLIRAGAVGEALRVLSNRYETMVGFSEAPTIWESWWPFVRVRGARYRGELPSWAHTGGVGPAWTLSRRVLGVYPVGPGFRQGCRIEPRTGYLRWARGVFPSVGGDIAVEWTKEKGRFALTTRLPDDLVTQIVLPRGGTGEVMLTHNGAAVEIGPDTGEAGHIQWSADSIAVAVVGGQHHVEVSYG